MATHRQCATPSLYELLDIAPVGRAAIVRLGRAELEAGRVDDAIETFGVATSLDPTDQTAWTGLLVAYRRAGRDIEAEAVAEFLSLGEV